MKTINKIWIYQLFVVGLLLMISNSCKKDDNSPVPITDKDGNVYNTVTIGTQIWMKENLRTTKYSNGDLIGTTIPANLDISNESAPKYQWAYTGNEINVTTYGRLYTWDAATDTRNVCPTGWHVPTDAEWTTLTTLLGGDSVAGGKLKEAGTAHWFSPNTEATNESGFTALPGGRRYFAGPFDLLGGGSNWWSSTEESASTAYFRFMYYSSSEVSRDYYTKPNGFYVRCIKD